MHTSNLKPHTSYLKPHTSNLKPHTSFCFLLSAFCFLLFAFFFLPSVSAQRLEVHAIKDLSTDENAKKAWGVGGGVDLDNLVKNTTFRVGFDWAMYKEKNNPFHNLRYNRMSGGITVFYSFLFEEKFIFQCGVELNYSYLKHSYIYKEEKIDSLNSRLITTLQTGNFIGIGPYIGVQYKLSDRFNAALSCSPMYLILVHSKTNVPEVPPEYNKGIWLFPIRLGLSYKLFKSDK